MIGFNMMKFQSDFIFSGRWRRSAEKGSGGEDGSLPIRGDGEQAPKGAGTRLLATLHGRMTAPWAPAPASFLRGEFLQHILHQVLNVGLRRFWRRLHTRGMRRAVPFIKAVLELLEHRSSDDLRLAAK